MSISIEAARMTNNKIYFEGIIEVIQSKKIKHVSFDFWNTLYESNNTFKLKRGEYLSKISSKTAEEIQVVLKNVSFEHNSNFDSVNKCLNAENLNELMLDNIGIKNGKEIAISTIYKLFNSYPPIVFKGLSELFEYLKAKNISISILSNTAYIPGCEIRKILDRDGLFNSLSFLLFSDELGFGKPNNIVFEKLISETRSIHGNIPISEILHVGDDMCFDVNPAIKIGIQALKV